MSEPAARQDPVRVRAAVLDRGLFVFRRGDPVRDRKRRAGSATSEDHQNAAHALARRVRRGQGRRRRLGRCRSLTTTRRVCPIPGCAELTTGGQCDEHRREAEARRGTARQRGYDSRWERRRRPYLIRNPICVLCGAQATVGDHHPISRRDLIAMGVRDPDADHRLRPLCAPCHSVETAKNQPGGWNAR